LNVKPMVTNVIQFTDRRVQVRRIEGVLYNERIDGVKLKRYADAGEEAIA